MIFESKEEQVDFLVGIKREMDRAALQAYRIGLVRGFPLGTIFGISISIIVFWLKGLL